MERHGRRPVGLSWESYLTGPDHPTGPETLVVRPIADADREEPGGVRTRPSECGAPAGPRPRNKELRTPYGCRRDGWRSRNRRGQIMYWYGDHMNGWGYGLVAVSMVAF